MDTTTTAAIATALARVRPLPLQLTSCRRAAVAGRQLHAAAATWGQAADSYAPASRAFLSAHHPCPDSLLVIPPSLPHPLNSQRESFEGTLLNFRKDGSPVLNHLHITPLYSDPRRPTLVTHYAGVICLRPADLNLGPLPLKPSRWLPDTLAGSQASLPVPASWAAGTTERDSKDWFADMGDREVSHLLGFLNLKGLAAMATTCRRMRRLAGGDPVWRCVCTRLWQTSAVSALERQARVLGWRRVAREIYTLEALHWRTRRVGGAVTPVRTNFSTCGLGDRVFVFGGEGADATAYNDLFVLDLGVADPSWSRVAFPPGALLPRGRWGHTLRELGSSGLVLFGGSSADGPVNDVFVLDAAQWPPQWREVHCSPEHQPVPRSWHGACTLGGKDLIIFGGCSAGGKLLSDTWRLNLDTAFPQWEQLSVGWTPPARLGLSLVATEEGRVFAFGGLASAGPVRLRSQDAFTMDLRSPSPTWHYVTGSQLPSGAAAAGTPPPPRLEQVAGTLIGGRVLVFGGSVNGGSDAAVTRAWEPYVMSPNSETPTWLRLRVTGSGPRDAWGYSTCMLGTHRFILAGKYEAGVLDMNELHELSLLSQPSAWESAADDSRGSNTAHEDVVLTAATDAGEPSGLGDLRYADGGGAGDYDDGLPDGSPGDDQEDCDSGQRSIRDEERSLAQPGEAQMQSGFGGAVAWGPDPSTSGGDSPGSIPVRRTDAVQLPLPQQQQQQQDGDESKQAHGGQWQAQAASQHQEEQSQREGTFPGLLPSALFPVLPLMASGARLLTQLRTAVVGGGSSQVPLPQPQTAGLTHLFAGSQPPREAMAGHGAQLPPHGTHRHVEPGMEGFLPHGDLTVDEERSRRRRSLTGRGLEHPRPNHSSGSDEEPSAKRGGLEEELLG